MEEGDQVGDETQDEAEEEEETEEENFQEGQALNRRPQRKKKPCNQRIDELSTPHKRIFLALWNEHAYHLPKDKVKHLKQLLQQLYALSPEETAKYFAELRAEAKAAAARRKLKQKLRKYLLNKHHQKQRQRAYRLFKKLLKCGISYAAQNPVPPLVSVRLRYLSDIILEQLCDMRHIEVPNRDDPDKLGDFLISVADWMAIAVERLYFAAQVSINEMTKQEEAHDESMKVPETYEDFKTPLASSTPYSHSLEDTMKGPLTYSQMGKPMAHSTPQASRDQLTYSRMGKPMGQSTPQASRDQLTYSRMGKPMGHSTPQASRDQLTYSRMGKPTGHSTPQASRDQLTYSRMGKPMGQSTPQASRDQMTYSGMGKPMGHSTPQASRDQMTYSGMGKPMGHSTPQASRDQMTYSGMGKPMGQSTPQASRDQMTYSGMGKPIGSSTPRKLSLDQTEEEITQELSNRPSLLPYYTFIEEGNQPASPKKPKAQSTPIKEVQIAPGVMDRTYLEIPPYGFQKTPKRSPRR